MSVHAPDNVEIIFLVNISLVNFILNLLCFENSAIFLFYYVFRS